MNKNIELYLDWDNGEYVGTKYIEADDINGYFIQADIAIHIQQRAIQYSYDTPEEVEIIREDIEVEDLHIFLNDEEVTHNISDKEYDAVVDAIKNKLTIY